MSRHVFRQDGLVLAADRARLLRQKGCTVWLTGLSGSGKSTIAHALEKKLLDSGRAAYVLDGDNIRLGLNSDLGFTPEAREENIRRIGEVARLFVDAGLIVITAFVSPYRADRERVRSLHEEGRFLEVFVDCPVEECERRDVKGLYAKARRGEVPDFTGISAPYEAPLSPELRLETKSLSIDQAVAAVESEMKQRGFFEA